MKKLTSIFFFFFDILNILGSLTFDFLSCASLYFVFLPIYWHKQCTMRKLWKHGLKWSTLKEKISTNFQFIQTLRMIYKQIQKFVKAIGLPFFIGPRSPWGPIYRLPLPDITSAWCDVLQYNLCLIINLNITSAWSI